MNTRINKALELLNVTKGYIIIADALTDTDTEEKVGNNTIRTTALNDLELLHDIVYDALKLGFTLPEIHIVYFFDDYKKLQSEFPVPHEIALSNLIGMANTLKNTIEFEDSPSSYEKPQGNIWVLFNDKAVQFRESGSKFNQEEISKVAAELNEFIPPSPWR